MADAGLRLAVEGEKEFKAALAEIDAAVKTNQKSMKLLTEEIKLNEQGMKDASSGFGSLAEVQERLSVKGKVLADSIEMQTEKVGLLDARVEEARETYGEYDKKTLELKNQLLDATTVLTKLTAEQEKNRQAMLDAQNSTKEYDDAVAALEAQLKANDAELRAMGGGLEELQAEYGETGKSAGSLGKSTEDLGEKYGETGKSADDLGKSTGDLGKKYGDTGKSADDLARREENLRKQNENLNAQNAKLSDSIGKQRELIDNLAKAQEVSAARYGEGSKQAEEYRKRLADATGQLDRMERELRENEQAIEDNNEAIESGGDAPNGMIAGLEKVEQLTGIKIPAGIETMIGGFGGGALAVGGVVSALGEVAKKMESIWKESISWAKDVTTKSAELDLSTEQYQELEYIAMETGASVDALTGSLSKISKKAGEAAYQQETLKYKIEAMREEMEKAQKDREYWSEKYVSSGFDEAFSSQVELATQRYQEAQIAVEELTAEADEATSYFDKLGISIYDTNGEVKDAITLMYELIDAYKDVESDIIRNYELSEVLGESYMKLKPFVDEGSESLKRMAQEGRELNYIVAEGQVEALNKAGISWDEFIMKEKRIIQEYAAMRESQEGFFGDTFSFLEQLGEMANELFAKIREGSNYKPFDPSKWNRGTTGSSFLDAIEGFLKGIFGEYASGTNYAPGGMALVGERGPEIVELPRGSKVYPNGTAPGIGGATVNESNVYNITIDASSVEEFNDIVRIAQTARVGMRRG